MSKLVAEFNHLEFDGGFVQVENSDELNLLKWRFEIEFSLNSLDGCFIFDKRNGQWNRNYCFGFISEVWFNHHPAPVKPGKYFFVDIGDGRRIETELDNGIAISTDVEIGKLIVVSGSYDGISLAIEQRGGKINSKEIVMNDTRGDGPLIIGSMGAPHTAAFPQYGLGMFKGSIKSFKLWSLEE